MELFVGLTLLAIPIVLPIASWAVAHDLRDEVAALEEELRDQQSDINRLTTRLSLLEKGSGIDDPSSRA
jgi:hypothetical protein